MSNIKIYKTEADLVERLQVLDKLMSNGLYTYFSMYAPEKLKRGEQIMSEAESRYSSSEDYEKLILAVDECIALYGAEFDRLNVPITDKDKARVHQAKAELKLTDEEYRECLGNAKPGAVSCTELKMYELKIAERWMYMLRFPEKFKAWLEEYDQMHRHIEV